MGAGCWRGSGLFPFPKRRNLRSRSRSDGSAFPPGVEEKLTHSAAQQGRNPDELVRDVVARYFEEEARFVNVVKLDELPEPSMMDAPA